MEGLCAMDDGIATGSTITASVDYLKRAAASIIIATLFVPKMCT